MASRVFAEHPLEGLLQVFRGLPGQGGFPPAGLLDEGWGEVLIPRHPLKPFRTHPGCSQGVLKHTPAHAAGRVAKLDHQTKAAHQGGVELADLVAHPDRRHWVGLEQIVDPGLGGRRLAKQAAERSGKHVLDLVEQHQRVATLAEQPLGDPVGADAILGGEGLIDRRAPGKPVDVGAFGVHLEEIRAERRRNRPGELGIAGAGRTVEEHIAALLPIPDGPSQRPLKQPEVLAQVREIPECEATLPTKTEKKVKQVLRTIQGPAQGVAESVDKLELEGHPRSVRIERAETGAEECPLGREGAIDLLPGHIERGRQRAGETLPSELVPQGIAGVVATRVGPIRVTNTRTRRSISESPRASRR
jgi:hypothetical protein